MAGAQAWAPSFSSVALDESLNFLEHHLCKTELLSPWSRMLIPRSLASNALSRCHTGSLCSLNLLLQSLGWYRPRYHEGWNIGCLSLKPLTSVFQVTAGPQGFRQGAAVLSYLHQFLWALNVMMPQVFSTLPGILHSRKQETQRKFPTPGHSQQVQKPSSEMGLWTLNSAFCDRWLLCDLRQVSCPLWAFSFPSSK